LWLFKRLQLIVCRDLVAQYLVIFRDVLGLDNETLEVWQRRWTAYASTTVVNLGR
jgi:hypothetical protein